MPHAHMPNSRGREAEAPTEALASAALAFFSRALQASKSRRRFWRSRRSFCRVGTGNSEAPASPGHPQQGKTGP